MLKLRYFIILFASASLLFGCRSEIDFIEGSSRPGPTEVLISGGNLSMVFTSGAGSAWIDLDATKRWTATFVNDRAKDWCTLSAESGKRGTATITVSVKENMEYDQRSASINFICGDAQRTVVVTQKQKDALLLTSNRQDVGKDGGQINVEVMANVAFVYEIAESAKSWIKPVWTKGMSSSMLLFDVSANEEIERREGAITITSALGSEIVHVYQEGATPTLIISQTEYSISDEGGDISVEIKSNVNFEYEIVAGADWISEIGTKAMSTHTLCFKVVDNETYDERRGRIRFYDSSTGLSEDVTIIQKQKDALLLTQNEYIVSDEGGYIEVEVKSNIDYEYEIAVGSDWISKVGTKGLNTQTFLFEIKANDTYDERVGKIHFYDKITGHSEDVIIIQKQRNAVLLTNNKFTISDEGGTVDVEVKSNINFEYEITEGEDWVTEIKTKSLTTHHISFVVQKNDTYDDRSCRIHFFDKETGLSEEVSIVQKQKSAILLTQHEYFVSDEEDFITIEAKVNAFPLNCVITKGQEWLSLVSTKSLTSISWQFKIKANETYDERIGKICFSNTDSGISEEATIIQKQKDALLLSHNEYSISDEGGLLTIEVKSNVEFKYDIIEGAGWISEVKTKGLSQYAIQFEVAANEASISRIGKIVFYSSSLEKEEGVTIHQQASEVERKALVKMFESMGGKNWKHKEGWCSDLPLDQWYGVSLNEKGRVEALQLKWNNLVGDIPESISALKELKEIDLFNNGLKRFPKALCGCLALEKINLVSNNEMSGTIPEEIGQLKYLEHLAVCSTHLEGRLPKSLLDLPCWKYGFNDIIEDTSIEYSVDDFVAPDFEVMDVRGNQVSSEELYSKFDYLVLTTAEAVTNGLYYDLLKVYKECSNVAIVEFIPSRYFDAGQLNSYTNNKDVPWPCVYLPQQNALLGNGSYGGDEIWSQKIILVDKNKRVVNVFEDFYSSNYPVYDYLSVDEGIYQSTDYSHDGEVITLQRATEGKGVDIIFMGDGYSDRMIEDGDYISVIQTAMEGFFEIEPYKSFRHLFNVYCVMAVSENEFYDKRLKTKTAFGVDVESSNGLTCNNLEKVRSYGRKAVDMDEDRFTASTIITVINSKNGRSVCYMGNPGMAFCVNSGFDEDYLTFVVQHEAGGHGFGKLSDEYVEAGLVGGMTSAPSYLSFTDDHKEWRSRNVDTTNDTDRISWSRFLRDSRYSDEVGIFEGGHYYSKGVYRPSEKSVMNSGMKWFNAPSREAIYYWIHKKAYCDAWEYDFEKFLEYDAINRNAPKTKAMPNTTDKELLDIRMITAPPVRFQEDDTTVVPWRR